LVAAGSAVEAEEQLSVFPLGRSWAGDRKLPLPFGIGVTYYYQKQDYELASLDVGPIPLPPGLIDNVDVTNDIQEINLKADLWLLPFLNVFGIIGDVNGETNVDLGPALGTLNVDYDGLVYGGGFTAAMGVKQFFTSLTTHFMLTDLRGDRSSVQAWLLTPKAGFVFERGAIWSGAMYQRADEEHIGTIEIPYFGEVGYEVVLQEKNPWNVLVGGQFELATHFVLEAEGGLGNRKHAIVSFTYRR
jgi:hypothetical protein